MPFLDGQYETDASDWFSEATGDVRWVGVRGHRVRE